MRVIHAIYSFTIGGSETMLVDIINEQCNEASVSLIIVNDKMDRNLLDTIDKRVNVFLINRRESSKIQLLSAFFKINQIVNRINPDVIHCHDNKLFPFFIRRQRKSCLTIHSVNLSVVFLKRYRRIFAISAAVQQNIKKISGINAQIVLNGIKIDQYKPRVNFDFDPGRDEFKIAQISRLCPEQKGQHIAIQAMRLLKEQNPNRNIRLYFIGGGEALAELKELAVRYAVQHQIVFEGVADRDRIKNNLRDYHVLIQPSLIEGFGLTIIEGFACGLPVIASDLDGPGEICRLLDAGLLARPGDPVDLAEKIYNVYQSYLSNTLEKEDYMLKDKNQLKIFDIQTTAKTYLENYKMNS
ncbi:MAG: glycosyltransferase family 4 protein [Tannerella sp.]|jgi:glycosyltransferase involved in cell wall biosynthesis|nr:glycosyltransferase family 4 protein [Tannerella sp.]